MTLNIYPISMYMTKLVFKFCIYLDNYFVEVQWGKILCNDEKLDVYGCLISDVVDSCKTSMAIETEIKDSQYLSIAVILQYIALTENKAYTINHGFSISRNENICICLCPQGNIIIQTGNRYKTVNTLRIKAEESTFKMIESPYITIEEYCKSYLDNDTYIQNRINKYHSPSIDLFDNYMKQFSYRYLVFFEKWKKDEEKWEKYAENDNVPVFDFIEESLYDGTHDKLHDGGLMKYHQAGKPKKLRVEWHIGKSEYSAYFWFEDERIREVFDRFYGAHPDTKTDFIIRIDAEKRKYELALYRYGLKEPQVIPEDVYQLLVFKNKFEDYRSDNYNQERGAWIW